MAQIVILGGGFGGVVAAQTLAQRLGPEHRITLVSRQREFTFFPALVRLAFGLCELHEVFYDLEHALATSGVELLQGEVFSLDPYARSVVLQGGSGETRLAYDYLIFALGRRLAAERVPGLAEYAHHPLTVGDALKFGEAVRHFLLCPRGQAVFGYCPDARLAVPVYETAFALDRALRARGERDKVKLTIISPDPLGNLLGGEQAVPALRAALADHQIELVPDFPVNFITLSEVWAAGVTRLPYDLLMLIPPFQGRYEAHCANITDAEGYVRVDTRMRSLDAERIYAVGDAVNFAGPKMAHMAILQGEVAAANLAAELAGREPEALYNHELMLVIDEGGEDSFYLHHKLWSDEAASLRQGSFWGWAKRIHERYWTRLHALDPVA
jgi:sulfide:quinone oxidoreductase